MVLPNETERIWWDGEETFIILSKNGRWFEVYPTYGDSYMVDSKIDKIIETYVSLIKKAYIKNGLRMPSVYFYNLEDKPMIFDQTGVPAYFEKINQWLKDKGFILKEKPSEKNWGVAKWEYQGEYGSDAQNPDMIKKISNMQDVTQKVGRFFNGNNSGKERSLMALKYLSGTNY